MNSPPRNNDVGPCAVFGVILAATGPVLADHTAQQPGVSAPQMQVSGPSDLLGEPRGSALNRALRQEVMSGTLAKALGRQVAGGAAVAARMAYAQTIFEPVWTRQGVHDLLGLKEDLFSYGIPPGAVIDQDLFTTATTRFSGSPRQRALADIDLTVAWLRIASALSGGLDDEGRAVESPEQGPARALLVRSLLSFAAGDAPDALDRLEPDHPQYQRLKDTLHRYRSLRERGGWLAIPGGSLIRLGDSDRRVPALRERLAAEGFLETPRRTGDVGGLGQRIAADDPASPAGERPRSVFERAILFDSELDAALRAFQSTHGLKIDGVLGPRTLEAINESVESKIDRIADTMNRWRLQGDPGSRYIWANIPSYSAEAWSDGRRELRMKTIVGKPDRQTPVFSDEVEYAVANPKWYAPESIVRRDKLPKLAEDPGYADRRGFAVYDRNSGERVSASSVDWTDPASAERYRLVQAPGDNNALGELKIIFPNQYSVYLHGTPSKQLFDEAERAFSSGCIRLEDPVTMAQWLAQNDSIDTARALTEATADEARQRVDYRESTPVHITYMTVTVGESGTPSFWRDVYDNDDGIAYVKEYAPLFDRPAFEKRYTELIAEVEE